MGKMTSSQQDPFHSGEVYHLWSYLYDTKLHIVTMQVYINHTNELKLKNFLEDLLEDNYKEEEQQIEAILKEAGIRLPPGPPDRPNVNVEDIPAGARINDDEITRFIQKKLMAEKLVCTYMISMLNQEDIITLFEDFHSQKTEHEKKLVLLMKENGWFVQPPTNIK